MNERLELGLIQEELLTQPPAEEVLGGTPSFTDQQRTEQQVREESPIREEYKVDHLVNGLKERPYSRPISKERPNNHNRGTSSWKSPISPT